MPNTTTIASNLARPQSNSASIVFTIFLSSYLIVAFLYFYAVVDSYLKQDMRFFVAKVNVEAQSKLGYQYLRPFGYSELDFLA